MNSKFDRTHQPKRLFSICRRLRVSLVFAVAQFAVTFSAFAGPLDGTFRGTYTCSSGTWVAYETFIVDAANRVRLIEAQYRGAVGSARLYTVEYLGTFNPTTRVFSLPTFRAFGSGTVAAQVTGDVTANGKTVRIRYNPPFGCTVLTATKIGARG